MRVAKLFLPDLCMVLSCFMVYVHQEKIISKDNTTSEKKAFLGGGMLANLGFQEKTSKKKQSSRILVYYNSVIPILLFYSKFIIILYFCVLKV